MNLYINGQQASGGIQVDQGFNPESENPISGKGVNGALTNYPNKVNFTSKGNTQFELDVSPYRNKCILIGYINSYSGDHIELMIYYSGYAIMETTLSKQGNATVSKDGNIVTLSDPGYPEGGLCKPFGIVLP